MRDTAKGSFMPVGKKNEMGTKAGGKGKNGDVF